MSEGATLTPEPWQVHLLGLISPILVIIGNLIGGIYTAMGVIFIWVIGPILDVVMGETKEPRPPRESGTPFEVLLWILTCDMVLISQHHNELRLDIFLLKILRVRLITLYFLF